MRRKLPFLGLLSVLLVSMGCQMNNQDPSDSAPTAPAPKAALLGADISAGGVSAGVSVGLSVPSVVPTAVPPLFPTNTPTPTNSFMPTRTVT
ncbi:MAG TPA: hypothetical protein VJ873_10355, partial [bacterium]|nr:hypothetical protein [bacterium]